MPAMQTKGQPTGIRIAGMQCKLGIPTNAQLSHVAHIGIEFPAEIQGRRQARLVDIVKAYLAIEGIQTLTDAPSEARSFHVLLLNGQPGLSQPTSEQMQAHAQELLTNIAPTVIAAGSDIDSALAQMEQYIKTQAMHRAPKGATAPVFLPPEPSSTEKPFYAGLLSSLQLKSPEAQEIVDRKKVKDALANALVAAFPDMAQSLSREQVLKVVEPVIGAHFEANSAAHVTNSVVDHLARQMNISVSDRGPRC